MNVMNGVGMGFGSQESQREYLKRVSVITHKNTHSFGFSVDPFGN